MEKYGAVRRGLAAFDSRVVFGSWTSLTAIEANICGMCPRRSLFRGAIQANRRSLTPLAGVAFAGASKRSDPNLRPCGPGSLPAETRTRLFQARQTRMLIGDEAAWRWRRPPDFRERGRLLPPSRPSTCCAARDPVFDRRQSIIDLAGKYAPFRTDVFRDQRSGRDRPSGVRGAHRKGHDSGARTASGTSLGAMRADIRSPVMRGAMQTGWIHRESARPSSSRSARDDERSHPRSIHEP
jgi:hypothetical protein